jgi:PST family polysaccharide transporter
MSLREKTISGLFWSALSQGGKQLSQFVITVILARLLSPSDFGLVAMATVFTGFAMIFGELGVGSALIQKLDAKEEHWSSAFWLNIFNGILLCIMFWGLAPYIAIFYGRPELKAILQVMSINFVLSSFVIIPQTILMKNLDFRKLMIRDISSVILSGAFGVALALGGYGVWSIVFQLLSGTVINNLLLWSFCSWRPKFLWSYKSLREIFKFSANLTGFQIINYFSRNTDQLLIGKFLGSQDLGYYSLAYKLMLMPLQNISWVISRVAFPAFSQIQNNLEKVRVNYRKMVEAISILTFPLMVFIYISAPELIATIYGPQWGTVSDLVSILCFCGMAQSVGTTVGTIYQALGRTEIQLKMAVLNAIIIVPAVLLGLRGGIHGVALSYTSISIAWLFFSFYVISRIVKFHYWEFCRNTFKSAITIALVLFVSAFAFKKMLHFSPIIDLLWLSGFGLVVYCGCLWILKIASFTDGKIVFKSIS